MTFAAQIPYGAYWSTPFAKWQGSLSHLHSVKFAAALQEGVGHLMRQAGLELMQLIMENEVRHTAGERYQRRAPEQPFRWGREKGFLVVDGQKVPIERPRLRSKDGREQRLGS